jgi:hypothetical protein
MKKWLVLFLVSFLAMPIIGMAKPGKNGKLKVKPSIVDPDHLHLVVAAWMPQQGIVDAGKSYHALYLQKDVLTSDTAYATAQVKPFTDKLVTDLSELGFDYKNGGHCTAVAPRFLIQVDGTDYSVGCASGVPSLSPDDPVNWTRVRFGPTELSAAGVPLTGTINSLKLVFDEGTDVNVGFIFLDNIDVNGLLIRKSGNGGPKS